MFMTLFFIFYRKGTHPERGTIDYHGNMDTMFTLVNREGEVNHTISTLGGPAKKM